MKTLKIVIVICTILFTMGCVDKDNVYVYGIDVVDISKLKTSTYDGCEYIVIPTKHNGAYTLVHKGNCKNHKEM